MSGLPEWETLATWERVELLKARLDSMEKREKYLAVRTWSDGIAEKTLDAASEPGKLLTSVRDLERWRRIELAARELVNDWGSFQIEPPGIGMLREALGDTTKSRRV